MLHKFVICLLMSIESCNFWIAWSIACLFWRSSLVLASKAFSRTVISSTLHSSSSFSGSRAAIQTKHCNVWSAQGWNNLRRGFHMGSAPLKGPAKHGSTQLHPRDLHLSWLKEPLTEITASDTPIQSTEISGQSVICSQEMPGASTLCLAALLLPSCSAVLSFIIRCTQHTGFHTEADMRPLIPHDTLRPGESCNTSQNLHFLTNLCAAF